MKSPLRILLVACWDLSRDDGPTVRVDAVAAGLAVLGHHVTVLAPTPARPLGDQPYALEYIRVPRGRLGPQIFAVLAALRVLRTRAHAVYVVDFETSLFAIAAARMRKLASVLEANGVLERDLRELGFNNVFHRAIVRLKSRASLRLADRIVAVSGSVADHAIETVGVEPRRVTVLQNGVHPEYQCPDEGRAEARRQLGLGSEPILGFLGGFQAWQGVERLIEVFPRVLARVENARLVVAGFGPMEATYRAHAERSPARERIMFPGLIPRAIAPLWNAAFDVGVHLVIPGRHCSSIKLAAYAAAGIPILATRTSDFAFVEEEEIGRLVDFDDDEEIAGVASELLLLSPNERRGYGERGRAYVVRERTWANVAQRTAQLIAEALAEKSVV